MLSERSTAMATTALVCGIVAFFIAAIPIFGIAAVALGIVALQRGIGVAMQRRAGRGRAITGAVLGGIGMLNGLWMPFASIIWLLIPLSQ